MTVEELMIPRYEVIALFPLSGALKVGQILIFNRVAAFGAKCCNESEMEYGDYERYPHLFRSLMWYEEREEAYLPMYLRNDLHESKTGKVEIIKVLKYEPYYVDDAEIKHWSFYVYPEWNPNEGFPLIHFSPATEQEYNDYIKSTTA